MRKRAPRVGETTATIQPPWSGYRFVPNPTHWDDTCHKHPCSETRALDATLNFWLARTIHPGPEWIEHCKLKALERNEGASHLKSKRVDPELSDLGSHENGIWGEAGFFLWCGVRPTLTVNTFGKPDLPLDIEIKTRSPGYDLKIPSNLEVAPDHFKFVLAICQGIGKEIRFAGWITAREGRRLVPNPIDPRRAGLPFHAIPEDLLWDAKELRIALRKHYGLPPE